MKEGEISSSFVGQDISMNQIGKMLKLVQVIPAHKPNLAEDWSSVEQLALSRKQEAEYSTWLNSKIDEMYVRIDPMFTPDDFDNKRWFK
jgi:peptidyl-prolyl cis-trans isomerase SurA